jgi:hypothetical protein
LQEPEPELASSLNVFATSAPCGAADNKWKQMAVVHGQSIKFMIDTGARCNTIQIRDFQEISHLAEIYPSSRLLRSYSNHIIRPIGTCSLPLTCNGITLMTSFEIVNLEQENVISGDTAEKLGLISRLALSQNIANEQNSAEQFWNEFPELKKTTGTLPGEYTIKLKSGSKGVVHPARRQPAALHEKIVAKLREMEELGQITKVTEPTEWVSSMTVSTRNDKIRICIDPKDLNAAIEREHYPMRTIEEIVAEIPDAKVFTKLDAKSGFLQIKLDEPSSYLTTFNTPVGRYRWLRLPFGIKCAPEVFQRIMDQMIEGIKGAFAVMDDILVAGRNVDEHDQILKQVVERATSYNLQLNPDKVHLRQSSIPYVGHLLTSDGLKPDPEKTRALQDMPAPQNKEDVKRFLGFVTYLGKFIPNLSEETSCLRALMKEDVVFEWQKPQQEAFAHLKQLCCSPPVLKYYDVKKPVEIQCDASQHGLGAVLLQEGKPVAYASRSMSETEQRYSQIEKELLSIVFACTRFHCYIFGKQVTVTNDHKPLEQIFKKPLQSVPMRLQRMLMSLQWYDLLVVYDKGSHMNLPDTLSRAHLIEDSPDVCFYDNYSLEFLSVTPERYRDIQEKTNTELQLLTEAILNGFPDRRSDLPVALRPYWDSRAELAVSDGVIYKGLRIVVPPSLQKHMLSVIHGSHLGIVKCKQRAREVLYWPAMNADIEDTVKNCVKCADYQRQKPAEPLLPTVAPDYPFAEVGVDIFEFGRKHFLLSVDYYSKFIEVDELNNLSCGNTITKLKEQFARHGIPERLRSDCGTQFTSKLFQQFCKEYGIQHNISSPHFQSSNGEAERAVQTVKNLWRKNNDKHLALLDYRTTPLEGINLSPAQLLMGRRPRNKLPASKSLHLPASYDHESVKQRLNDDKARQKRYHDKPGSKQHTPFQQGDEVRMAPYGGNQQWKPAVVLQPHSAPRSYLVQSGDKVYRRTSRHLRHSTRGANRR